MSRKTGKRFQHGAGDWLGDDCSFSFGAVDDRTINESVTRPKYGLAKAKQKSQLNSRAPPKAKSFEAAKASASRTCTETAIFNKMKTEANAKKTTTQYAASKISQPTQRWQSRQNQHDQIGQVPSGQGQGRKNQEWITRSKPPLTFQTSNTQTRTPHSGRLTLSSKDNYSKQRSATSSGGASLSNHSASAHVKRSRAGELQKRSNFRNNGAQGAGRRSSSLQQISSSSSSSSSSLVSASSSFRRSSPKKQFRQNFRPPYSNKRAGNSSATALTIDDSSDEDDDESYTTQAHGVFIGESVCVTREASVKWPACPTASASAEDEPDGGDGPVIEVSREGETRMVITLKEIRLFNIDTSNANAIVVIMQVRENGQLHKRLRGHVFSPEVHHVLMLLKRGRKLDAMVAEIKRRVPVPLVESSSSTSAPSSSSAVTDSAEGTSDSGDDETLLSQAMSFLNEQKKNFVHRNLDAAPPSPKRRSMRSSGRRSSVTGEARVIIQYPPEKTATDPVVLTEGDRGRLDQWEFLNDNLVDWYLKFMRIEGAAASLDGGTDPRFELDLKRPSHRERNAKVHFFTSHFYKKLTGHTGRATDDDDDDDDDDFDLFSSSSSSSTTGRKRKKNDEAKRDAHSQVARWTKDFDIFSKQFVFVPIVEHLHWSLAIIANLDNLEDWLPWRREQDRKEQLLQERSESISLMDSDEDDESVDGAFADDVDMTTELNNAGEDADSGSDTGAEDKKDPAGVHDVVCEDDSSGENQKEGDRADDSVDESAEVSEAMETSAEHQDPQDVDDGTSEMVDVESSDAAEKQDHVEKDRVDEDADEDADDGEDGDKKSEPRRPCIIFMDSLNMHSATQVCNNLKHYLKHEWAAKKSKKLKEAVSADESDAAKGLEDNDFLEELLNVPTLKPKVPKQYNCCDCGVYTVQYAEEVYKRWPHITEDNCSRCQIDGFEPKMFTSTDIKVRVICALMLFVEMKRKALKRSLTAISCSVPAEKARQHEGNYCTSRRRVQEVK